MLVADLEELETMDDRKSTQKDSMQKEVIFPKENGNLIFSSRRWTNQTSRRRSGTENTHLDTGTPISRRKSRRFLGESQWSPPPLQDSLQDAGEAINDFRSVSENFIFRHHVEPLVKLTRREKNHFLFH